MEKLFGLTIFNREEYRLLLENIDLSGKVARKYAKEDLSHNFQVKVQVELSELGHAYSLENIVWDDLQKKRTNDHIVDIHEKVEESGDE